MLPSRRKLVVIVRKMHRPGSCVDLYFRFCSVPFRAYSQGVHISNVNLIYNNELPAVAAINGRLKTKTQRTQGSTSWLINSYMHVCNFNESFIAYRHEYDDIDRRLKYTEKGFRGMRRDLGPYKGNRIARGKSGRWVKDKNRTRPSAHSSASLIVIGGWRWKSSTFQWKQRTWIRDGTKVTPNTISSNLLVIVSI